MALNGTVPSYPQYLEAAAAAQRVSGVKNVHNHLEVVLPPGNYRDDAMLTTAANNALAANITVPDGVEATAYDGNVELTGTVRYGPQRAAAELAVTGLTGVRNIRDDIEIGYDADPAGVTAGVQDALDRYALIADDSVVTVGTSGNTVTLYRPRPHLGRARRGDRRGLDGQRRLRCPRRPRHHGLATELHRRVMGDPAR